MGTKVHWSLSVYMLGAWTSYYLNQSPVPWWDCWVQTKLYVITWRPLPSKKVRTSSQSQTSSPHDSKCALRQRPPANAKRNPQGQDRRRMMPPPWDTYPALSLTVASQEQKHKPKCCQNPRNSHVSTKIQLRGWATTISQWSRSKWGTIWRTWGSVSKCLIPSPDPGFWESSATYGCWLPFPCRNPFKNVLLL